MSLLFAVCTNKKWGEHGLVCGSTAGAKQTQHCSLELNTKKKTPPPFHMHRNVLNYGLLSYTI